jgi:hypothetical protein
VADQISNSDVIAFRLAAHGLAERLDEGGLLEAAGRCAVQNSPPGSALLALHARVRNLTREQMAAAIAEDKSLLQSWCMRGAPFAFPTADAPVFTTGVLPPTEEAMRHLIPGVVPALDQLDMRLIEAVERTRAEVGDVLSGRRLAINELGTEIAERAARRLPSRQRDVWLEHPIADVDPEVARAELLRRYLRCYGPSTRRNFAAWAGIHVGDADPWWTVVEDELTPVELDGTAWILTEDLDALRSAPTPTGVRLLPPRDPYTQMRDRETIVDTRYHRDVWRTVGEPGAVLAGGRITGTWRPRKSGRKLTIAIKTFNPLPPRDRESLQDEAEQVAPLRGASSAEVTFDTY